MRNIFIIIIRNFMSNVVIFVIENNSSALKNSRKKLMSIKFKFPSYKFVMFVKK